MPKQIQVKVIPRAKKSFVKEEAGSLKVYTTAPAIDGKANEALVEDLAEYLSVRKRQISIVRGLLSRNKTVEVSDF